MAARAPSLLEHEPQPKQNEPERLQDPAEVEPEYKCSRAGARRYGRYSIGFTGAPQAGLSYAVNLCTVPMPTSNSRAMVRMLLPARRAAFMALTLAAS